VIFDRFAYRSKIDGLGAGGRVLTAGSGNVVDIVDETASLTGRVAVS